LSHDQKNERDAPAGEDDGSRRVLLNPEEWKEPSGRKVIGEYHKDGLPEGLVDATDADKSDLDSFAGYWKGQGTKQMHSEYHKHGAPYMEAPSEWDGHRPRDGRPPDKAGEKDAHDSRERARGSGDGAGGDVVKQDVVLEEKPSGGDAGDSAGKGKESHGSFWAGDGDIKFAGGGLAGAVSKHPRLERVLDVSTVEVLTFAMFRAIFGRGIRIPLKIEGALDMEIVAKDKDIVLNTNQLYFQVPELSVWRFIFAYKGKPVIEYGRGIKNQIRIHYYRMFVVLLAAWWGSWRRKRAHRQKIEAEAEADAMYAAEGRKKQKEEGAGKK
jgi:hypothetical protein